MSELNDKIDFLLQRINFLLVSFEASRPQFVFEDETYEVDPIIRTLRALRRRINAINELTINNEGLSSMLDERLSKDFSSLNRRLTQLLRENNDINILIETIKSRNYFLSFSRHIREALDEISLLEREKQERQNKLLTVDEIYTKTKFISEEIVKEYEKLSFFTSKIKDQQDKIDMLEQQYRNSIKNITFDEEDFKDKQAVISKGYSLSQSFLVKTRNLDADIEELKIKTAGFHDLVNDLNRCA
ncbi:hypothetical protein [Erwinia mallotivora]|uniref:Uncharacterized protein n=1 Tax=Erwinia mallotivora TaxID=69222 RepID=A0A014NQR2_9GAMM|nr:hypothetical protein [Erwinia mallotivora]EXU76170.1 hypothetical protein BG55_07355 [Erwinia mallotivora]